MRTGSPLYGGGAGGHSWSMVLLFLRGLPLQAGFSIIDAVSKPALSRLRKQFRARGMYSMFLVDGKKKSCICTCVPDVLCQEL